MSKPGDPVERHAVLISICNIDNSCGVRTTRPNREPVLVVTELTKVYGGRTLTIAVDYLSFTLGSGEIPALLGPNGAGTTITILMLLSTLSPMSGGIDCFGQSLELARETMLAQVGFASAYTKLRTYLTIHENLDVFGRLYELPRAERKAQCQELRARFRVRDLRQRIMAGLSAGEATCAMLAKAFLALPSVVLLDEPTASLNVKMFEQSLEGGLRPTRQRLGPGQQRCRRYRCRCMSCGGVAMAVGISRTTASTR